MTELDRKIREMALNNWEQFVATIGEDAIKRAKICMLRQSDLSLTQISNKTGYTRNQVQYGCEQCGAIAKAQA